MALDFRSDKHREPAECVISVGTAQLEITKLYPCLTEVVVETSVDKPSVALLTFETRRDENGQWSVQDAGLLAPWEPIRIEAAFGSATEEVMRGYIREIKAEYPGAGGIATVAVECQDESIALDREHIRRKWGAEQPSSDAMILHEIVVGNHGLMLDPDSQDGLSGLVLHQDATDIRFLRQRALFNGYELIFREGMVYFGPMRLEAEAQDPILVQAGPDTHCYSLSIRDDGHLPDKVAFDAPVAQGQGATGQVVKPDLTLLGNEPADSAASGLREFVWKMREAGGMSEEELQAVAQKKANDSAMKVRAEGELDGSLYGHVLRVGEPVMVDGVGDRYGGTYYVSNVTHRFGMEGYREQFTLLRNAYGDNSVGTANPLAGVL